MTIKQHLEDLRQSGKGYCVVAFGDAATRLILLASHDTSYRRENLDQLCDRAAECFRMLDTAAGVWPSGVDRRTAYLHLTGATIVFVRSGADASEFLCIVCDGPLHADQMAFDAQQTLDLIAA